MVKIAETLSNRNTNHGDFEENARITQNLLRIAETSPNYDKLSNCHREALHMIFAKISRMLCGDQNNNDNPHDIAGYALLLEQSIKSKKHGKTKSK